MYKRQVSVANEVLERIISATVGSSESPPFACVNSPLGLLTTITSSSSYKIGKPKLNAAKIDLPIGRNPLAPSTFRIDPNGKPAQTTYHVLAENDTQSFVELKPTTGRTHQLRVHLAHLNAPILGDRVYGKSSDCRMMLHAQKLEITLPSGERKVFEAAIPDEFKRFFPEDL
mgnify:CR=1 FL=1